MTYALYLQQRRSIMGNVAFNANGNGKSLSANSYVSICVLVLLKMELLSIEHHFSSVYCYLTVMPLLSFSINPNRIRC